MMAQSKLRFTQLAGGAPFSQTKAIISPPWAKLRILHPQITSGSLHLGFVLAHKLPSYTESGPLRSS